MGRTTREEHSRICEQCRRMEAELERLRMRLNDAEDQVKKLEVKMFPGQARMLKEASNREADARSAYSEAQHRLDDIKRQERLLRMKMRREENEITVIDIPEVSEIGEVIGIMDEADVHDIPDISVEDIPEAEMPEPEVETPKLEEPEPRHCEEDHVFEEVIVERSMVQKYDGVYGEEFRKEPNEDFIEDLMGKGTNLWNQAKKTWRVMNKMDVPENESLRLEIMSQVYEIEETLRRIRSSVGTVKVLGAIKATNDLANLKPKITRLSHLVDSAKMECPHIHFPAVVIPDADGFSLLEDVLSKKGSDNHVSTAEEIDKFLAVLTKLKIAVKQMPEREGVVDRL